MDCISIALFYSKCFTHECLRDLPIYTHRFTPKGPTCSRRSVWGFSVLLKEGFLWVQCLAQGGAFGGSVSCSRRSGWGFSVWLKEERLGVQCLAQGHFDTW